MGRTKKTDKPVALAEPVIPQESSNKAETIILPEEEKRVSSRSKRRSLEGIQSGEVVTIRNKQNGAENSMSAEYAVKLVQRNPELYEVVR